MLPHKALKLGEPARFYVFTPLATAKTPPSSPPVRSPRAPRPRAAAAENRASRAPESVGGGLSSTSVCRWQMPAAGGGWRRAGTRSVPRGSGFVEGRVRDSYGGLA